MSRSASLFNPLDAKLNPICRLLELLGTHHILHASRIRVNEHYLYLLYFQFSTFFQTHPFQPPIVSSSNSFTTTAFSPPCAATNFVQIMHRVWYQACPSPPQEGVCGREVQAPQDWGGQTALGFVRYILCQSSSEFCWTQVTWNKQVEKSSWKVEKHSSLMMNRIKWKLLSQ